MGKILRNIQSMVQKFGSPEVGTTVTRGHTGRVSTSLTNEEQACEILVNHWLEVKTDHTHLGRQLVKELIDELPRCGLPVAYRARDFLNSAQPIGALDFGPNPKMSAGRYNRSGQAALYMGRESYGLSAEMAPYAHSGRQYYFARYLPTAELRLVDLSALEAHAALHHAFDRAERLDADYEASQRLADVIRELDIDGAIVPGVRGATNNRYTNVVVFRHANWTSWVDMQFTPQILAI